MRKQALLSVALLSAIVLVGCNVNNTTSNTTTTPPSNTGTTADETPIDSCSLITAADVQSSLGITVTARSTAIGSCNLTNDAGDNILLQVVAVDLYTPAQYTDISERSDIGEKAFVQTPTDGRSTSQASKGGKTFILNIFSTQTYTVDQEAALLKLVVDRG